MHDCGGGAGVGRHAGVVPGVGEQRLGDQQLAGGASFRLLRLQADAAPGRVKVHDGVTVVPQHGGGRRGVDVDGAREGDGAALLHVHLWWA